VSYFLRIASLVVVLGCASNSSVTTNDNNPSACLRGPFSDAVKNVQLVHRLRSAIDSNSAATVKQLLDGVSFRCPTGFSLSGLGRHDASDTQDNGELRAILRYAIEKSKGVCRDGIVPQLVGAGIPISLEQGIQLAQYGCHGAAMAAFKVLEPGERLTLITRFSSALPMLVDDFYRADNQPGVKRVLDLRDSFERLVIETCGTSVDAAPICESREVLAQAKAQMPLRMKSLAAEAEHRESPEFLVDGACEKLAEIRQYEAKIEQEREIGAVSGAVNLDVLHSNGEMVVSLKKELSDLIRQYKERTGKTMALKGRCR
jgi:hypothetical protein